MTKPMDNVLIPFTVPEWRRERDLIKLKELGLVANAHPEQKHLIMVRYEDIIQAMDYFEKILN